MPYQNSPLGVVRNGTWCWARNTLLKSVDDYGQKSLLSQLMPRDGQGREVHRGRRTVCVYVALFIPLFTVLAPSNCVTN